jgi:hypothetical protein
MSVFAVTFRIERDATYSDRYESLVEQIKKQARNGNTWDEPTSFVLIESAKSAKDLCDRLYYDSKIIEPTDTLLVVNLSLKEYAQRGAKYPYSLDSLMGKR